MVMDNGAPYVEDMSYEVVETEEVIDHSNKQFKSLADDHTNGTKDVSEKMTKGENGKDPSAVGLRVKLDSGKIVFLIKPDQVPAGMEELKKARERSEVVKHLVKNRPRESERQSKHQVPEENGDNDEEEEGMDAQDSPSFGGIVSISLAAGTTMTSTSASSDFSNLGQSHQEFMMCLICGDRSTGYHYSAQSCEGCKGFFKRTVQRNMIYSCRETQNCDINKITRNNCQYCRFQKCLDVGMKKEAVREDRTPGGKQKVKRPKVEDSEVQVLEDCISQLIQARPEVMPYVTDSTSDTPMDRSSILEVNNLMHFGYMELRLIIEWARRVPGFGSLVLQDQIALLKSSFMELNVLRLAFRSLTCEGSVKFTEGLEIPLDQCSSMGLGQDLIKFTLEFISRLRFTNIDSTEFAILNAVVLTYPDASGLVDKKSVTNLQTRMLDCLQHYAATRHPREPRRYGRLLLRLPSLRMISARAAEMFLSLSLEGNVKMNALVLEMMDKV